MIDPRFRSILFDPRFKRVPKKKSKITLDSRFSVILNDKKFSPSTAPLDKRGKPKKSSSKNSLRRYYQIEDEGIDQERGNRRTNGDLKSEEDNEQLELNRLDRRTYHDSAKEKNEDDYQSSENETTTDEDDVGMEWEAEVPEIEEEVPVVDEGTKRLAIVNMDWRHVRAIDIYMVLRSFLPKGGDILSVAVYPSEFGLQRMKEEVNGPVGLFDEEEDKNGEDEDGNDEIEYEKLREYEKSKLRYYYAVAECDSVATADYLYKSCDGVEFERSSNILDLRFIPNSVEFKHPPRDVATEVPGCYEGLDYHTRALQHSNIPISWEDDEPRRVKILRRKFNADQIAEMDFKDFLASDESDDGDDENVGGEERETCKVEKREKYRALVESANGSEDDGDGDGRDMEITFNTGLEDLNKRILERRNKKSETVWEATLRKRREKKQAKRKNKKGSSSDEFSNSSDGEATGSDALSDGEECAGPDVERVATREELELLLADDKGGEKGVRGYDLKPKKSKGKRGKEIPLEKIPTVELDDPRFSALFTSPLFALDPTDPQFKRSAVYARQLALKQQGYGTEWQGGADGESKTEHEQPELITGDASKSKDDLSCIVKAVKLKSKQVALHPSSNKKREL